MCKKRGGDRHGVSLTRFNILVGFALLWGPTAAPAQIQSGLVGYWKLDGNYTDLSPGHRDLTPVGGIAFGTGVMGQGVVFPNDASLWLQRSVDDEVYDFGAGDFTITLWVKFTGLADNQVFVEKWAGPSGPGWTFAKHPDNSILFNAAPGALVSPVQSLTPGVWYHFVVTRSGNSIEMYRDNVLIASQYGTYVGPITNNAKPLLFGLRDLGVFPLDGHMDNVAIWSRALSSQELTDLYTAHQMVCGCTPSGPPDCPTLQSGFAGGDGTPGNPYQVCSPSQLDNIRNHLSAHFIQTADIDMCGWGNFSPIGNNSTRFEGNFNGQYFHIDNLTVNTSLTNDTGFFGVTGINGIANNMSFINCNANGLSRVGCISGRLFGQIQNSRAIGTARGTGDFVGLLTGEINTLAVVNKSFSNGATSGRNAVGGAVGAVYGSLSDVYSHASSVSSLNYSGGLAGFMNNGGTVSNCYSTGFSTGPGFVGGLIGFLNGTNVVKGSYWDVDSSGLANSAAGTGKTTSEMHQQATFVGWDFVNTWSIDEGNDYPRLRSLSAPAPPGETDCGNNFDDDCDSYIDCFDPDCRNDAVACPNGQIPAVSAWGLLSLSLLTLVAGTLIARRTVGYVRS